MPSAQAWRGGGEYLTFEGHHLFARRGGSGVDLLLIHGFPTSSFDWARVWPTLGLAAGCDETFCWRPGTPAG